MHNPSAAGRDLRVAPWEPEAGSCGSECTERETGYRKLHLFSCGLPDISGPRVHFNRKEKGMESPVKKSKASV